MHSEILAFIDSICSTHNAGATFSIGQAMHRLELLSMSSEDPCAGGQMSRWATIVFIMGCGSGKITIDGEIGDDEGTPIETDTGGMDDTGALMPVDADRDGYDEEFDCNDNDASIHPEADEHCDGVDEDCDGEIDEDPVDPPSWYLDADGDGFGSPDAAFVACEAPVNAVAEGTDCDDADDAIHPGATEECGDGIDNDCDGHPGDCGLEGWFTLEEAGGMVVGSRPDDQVGLVATAAGDVNGDGLDDLIIGIPNDDEETIDAGMVAIVFGPIIGEVSVDTAGLVAFGETIEDRAGSAVCAAGYINDDLFADVAIGAPDADTVDSNAGAVYLVYGRSEGEVPLNEADTKYLGEAEDDRAGSAVVRAGDMDGDGKSELAIGAESASLPLDESGAVYIISPGALGTFPLAGADVRLNGVIAGERAGHTLEPAGDLDDDGTDDLIVGAPYNPGGATGDDSGRVYIVFGGAELQTGPINEAGTLINGEGDNAFVGHAIAGVGDVNEDGHRDLVLAAYNGDSGGDNAGEIYIMYGPFNESDGRTITDADVTLLGEASDDHAGYALAAAGDYNRDGMVDLLVGSNGNDYGANNAGAAYVLYGPLDDPLTLAAGEVKIYGTHDDDWAGANLGLIGDMDGDGTNDIFVAAPYSDNPNSESGSIGIFYGNAGM
jgi:hypothetical protein